MTQTKSWLIPQEWNIKKRSHLCGIYVCIDDGLTGFPALIIQYSKNIGFCFLFSPATYKSWGGQTPKLFGIISSKLKKIRPRKSSLFAFKRLPMTKKLILSSNEIGLMLWEKVTRVAITLVKPYKATSVVPRMAPFSPPRTTFICVYTKFSNFKN